PRLWARAVTSSASSRVRVMGFSRRTSTPWARAWHATSAWLVVGITTLTARTAPHTSSRLAKARTPSSPASSLALSGRRSYTPTSSAPETCCNPRACFLPCSPTPSTATATLSLNSAPDSKLENRKSKSENRIVTQSFDDQSSPLDFELRFSVFEFRLLLVLHSYDGDPRLVRFLDHGLAFKQQGLARVHGQHASV